MGMGQVGMVYGLHTYDTSSKSIFSFHSPKNLFPLTIMKEGIMCGAGTIKTVTIIEEAVDKKDWN